MLNKMKTKRPSYAKGWSERDMVAHLMSSGLTEKDAQNIVKEIIESEI